jgi:hypothetical protein
VAEKGAPGGIRDHAAATAFLVRIDQGCDVQTQKIVLQIVERDVGAVVAAGEESPAMQATQQILGGMRRLCQDNRIAQKRGRGVGWRDG